MSKFNSQKFRAVLESEAKELGVDFKRFFYILSLELNRRRPNKKECLHLVQLVGEKISLSSDAILHVKSCRFCSVLIKGAWMQSGDEDEIEVAVRCIISACKMTLEHYEATIFDESVIEADDPHFGYMEMVCFDSLSPERRNHKNTCKKCALTMLTLEIIPLPDLS